VPSSSSSLNVSPYAIGLPSISGWDRTAQVSILRSRRERGRRSLTVEWCERKLDVTAERGKRDLAACRRSSEDLGFSLVGCFFSRAQPAIRTRAAGRR
jgi:hypothetical protein